MKQYRQDNFWTTGFKVAWRITLVLCLLSTFSFAQNTVSSVTSSTASGSSFQRKTFIDTQTNVHWAFYYDAGASNPGIQYSSSTDGSSWTARGDLPLTASDFSLTYKTISGTSYVFVTYVNSSTGDLTLRRGVLSSNSIVFESAFTLFVSSAGLSYRSPVAAVSASNSLWIAAVVDNDATYEDSQTRVVSLDATAGTFSILTNTPLQKKMHAVQGLALVPQLSSAMALFVNGDGGNVQAYKYDGSSWGLMNTGGDLSWFGFGGTTLSGTVKAIAVDPSTPSNVYVGGTFRAAGGNTSANYIARWNGSTWNSLGSGIVGYEVSALKFVATKLYVGGYFDSAGGVANTLNIAAWNTTSSQWEALGTGLNGQVYAMDAHDSDLYVGGDFTSAGGISGADRFALWNGTSFSQVGGASLNGIVRTIAAFSSEIFVGGDFTSIGAGASKLNISEDPHYVAKWDQSNWVSLTSDTALDGPVYAIAFDPGGVVVGGAFQLVMGVSGSEHLAHWSGTWNSGYYGTSPINDVVKSLAVEGITLYVGGEFINAGGDSLADHFATHNGSSWSSLGTVGVDSDVLAIAIDSSNSLIYAAGSFSSTLSASSVSNAGVGPIGVYSVTGMSWSGLGQAGPINGDINALAFYKGELYVGGNFLQAGGVVNADYIARWDGSVWNYLGSVSTKLNAPVLALLVTDENSGSLIVGGKFTNSLSLGADYIAAWDGSSWSSFSGIQLNGEVTSLAYLNSSIIAGGAFIGAGSVTGNDHVARWTGSSWTFVGSASTFASDAQIKAMAVVGNTLYVGGSFSNPGSGIASFDGSTWSALSSGVNGVVYALAVSGTDLYVGGTFSSAGGNASGVNIAKWDGSAWSALGSGLDGRVTAIGIDGSSIVAGGYFQNAGGVSTADYLASWNGSSWAALGQGVNGPSYALLARSGTLYVGGEFSYASPTLANHFALRTKAVAITNSSSSEISAVSDSTSANIHLLYNTSGPTLSYREYVESGGAWATVVTLVSPSGALSSPALSIDQSSGKLLAAFIEAGQVKTLQGKSPYSGANWSATSTTIDSASNNLGLISSFNLTNSRASLFWTKGSGAPYALTTQLVRTTSTISGLITTTSGALAAVTVDGGTLGQVTTDSNGAYTFSAAPDGTNYTITPSKSAYDFAPTSASVTVPGDATQNFTAAPSPITISGQVTESGTGLQNVSVTVKNSSNQTLGSATTDSSGNYSVSGIVVGTAYVVTPTLNGYTFTPTSSSGTASVNTTVSFTAVKTPYKLSGVISSNGRPIPGVKVDALINGQAQSSTTNGKGVYSFSSLTLGMTYSLTPSLLGHTFTPTTRSGTVAGNTTENFSDSLDTHRLSGTVTVGGKPLSGVTIEAGFLGDVVTDSAGAFDFPTVDYATPYTIRPVLKGYTFTPESSSGTLITDVALTFTATADQFSISGKVTSKGKALSGVLIDGGALGKKTSDSDGSYKFTKIPAGTSFALAPSLSGYSFSPPRIAGVVTADLKINFKVRAGAVFGGEVERISQSSDGDAGDQDSADSDSSAIAMSSDGKLVAFSSLATTLVDDDTNAASDVFLKDRATGLISRISVSTNGDQGDDASGTPQGNARAVSISADGSFVGFHSLASNLVQYDHNDSSDIILYEVATGTQHLISVSTAGVSGDGSSFSPSVSDAGKFVAFGSTATDLIDADTNGETDIFLRNVSALATSRVSVSSAGVEANDASFFPSINSDGDRVVFVSSATNLIDSDSNGADDIFLRNVTANSTSRVSGGVNGAEPNGDSSLPTISANGKVIAYASEASNLVTDDTNEEQDIFVYDVDSGVTERVSISSAGDQADGPSGFGEIGLSADGRFVIFSSEATNLVEGDKNQVRDVFVHDRQKHLTGLVSRSALGTLGNAASSGGVLSVGGTRISFTSEATNLLSENDSNSATDVFVRPVGPLPEVFRSGKKIEVAPTIVTTSKSVTVVMNAFQTSSSSASVFDRFQLMSIGEEYQTSDTLYADASAPQIRYVVTVSSAKSSADRTRQNSKRNTLTIRSVTPGKYVVSYHAELLNKKKIVAKTKESPKQKFTVKK